MNPQPNLLCTSLLHEAFLKEEALGGLVFAICANEETLETLSKFLSAVLPEHIYSSVRLWTAQYVLEQNIPNMTLRLCVKKPSPARRALAFCPTYVDMVYTPKCFPLSADESPNEEDIRWTRDLILQ